MNGKKRIALYGGTFDPVHLGHLAVARKVSQLFEIDELLFVPAWVAPHKRSRAVTPGLHRYAMLALATQEDPQLRISSFELDSSDHRYTVETLAHFETELKGDAELFFVMGADSWTEIRTWKDWERVLTMANHIVITRPGYDLELSGLSSEIRQRIVDTRGAKDTFNSRAPKGKQIFFTDAVQVEISATDIRHAARERDLDRLRKLVSKPVADYIVKYELYRETNES